MSPCKNNYISTIITLKYLIFNILKPLFAFLEVKIYHLVQLFYHLVKSYLQKNMLCYNQLMKIMIDIVDVDEPCVVIKTKTVDESIINLQQMIDSAFKKELSIVFYKGDVEYYFDIEKVLFFETSNKVVCAHTADDVFDTNYKLYELETLLPQHFVRISKSAIVNSRKIYSITKNITASSCVEFKDSYKKVYVSRAYYKDLVDFLKRKR